jgi:biofilm PGA synthesis protein PgaA
MRKLSALPSAVAVALALATSSIAHAQDAYAQADALAAKGQRQEALDVLRQVTSQQTAPARALALEVYLLTDTQQFAQAQTAATRATRLQPKEASVWLARAYAQNRAGQKGPALLSYQEVLKLEPTNKDALEAQVALLKGMGNQSSAYDVASKAPQLFDAKFLDQLRHAKAVELLRIARAEPSAAQRKKLLNESLALLRQETLVDAGRLADRLVVLSESGNDAETVTLYEEALRTTGVSDWALVSVAGSYSHLGKLQAALDLLERAYAKNAKDQNVVYALVYAYCDLQRFVQAREVIDTFIATQRTGSPELRFASQLQAQVALWSGDNARAGTLLEAARTAYPDHTGIRLVYVSWLNAVGRRTDAKAQLEQMLAVDANDVEARVMLAELQADTQPEAAMKALEELQKTYPDDTRIARSQREVARALKGGVWASYATSADRDSSGKTYALSAQSPTLTDHGLRLLLSLEATDSQLASGTVQQRQVGVGVEQPLIGTWTGQASLVRNDRGGDVGARLRMSGELFEGIPMSVKTSTLDAEVPAKGVTQGLTSKTTSVQVSHQFLGSVNTSAAVSRTQLSDGNVREGLSMSASGQGPALGVLRTDWAARAGMDRASKTNVSYFSPARDSWTELETGLRLPSWNAFGSQLLVWRPYAAIGSFSQTGRETLLTTNIGLGMSWSVSKDLLLSFDLHHLRRPYDGAYSAQTSGQMTVQSKLP